MEHEPTPDWTREHGAGNEVWDGCAVCGYDLKYLQYKTTHCPGRSTTRAEIQKVEKCTLDFIDGHWIDDPLLIAAMRAAAKAEV